MDSSNTLAKKNPLSKEEAETRKLFLINPVSGQYSVHYKLLLVIRRSKDKLDGEEDEFAGRVDVIFDFYPRDLDREHVVQQVTGCGCPFFLNFTGTVHAVEINSQSIPQFTFNNQRLEIDINHLEANAQNKISVLFSAPYNHSGVGLHHYIDPSDLKEYLYTEFEPYDCNRLFPCFDQPDIKAELELGVVSPKEWIVLSNENEKEFASCTSISGPQSFIALSDKDSDLLFTSHDIYNKDYNYYIFHPTPRISSYLYALCAGPYYCMNCPFETKVPLRLFFRESLKQCGEPEEVFKVTLAGLKFYQDYFGVSYPFSKYDQIFCPEYNMGAMENVGLVTLNEFYCWKDPPTQRRRTGFAITILHELAHMWFGNLVTMKWWDDLWLNESFATFISHLCMSQSPDLNTRYSTSWLLFSMYKGMAYSADQLPTTHPVMSDVKNTEIAESNFDEIVYEKGSSILKQMYYYIGDETFSKGLKAYFEKFKWSNTVFDDFISQMIEETGNKISELRHLSSNWLRKAGLNEISLQMEVDDMGVITKFDIHQKPCRDDYPNLQTHMVDILFIYDIEIPQTNYTLSKITYKDTEITNLSEPLGTKAPAAVLLNYNDWGYFKWVIDRTSINYLKGNLSKINDTLSKQLVLRSLFDLTRDSKISALEFLDIILPVLDQETNDVVLLSVMRNIQGIINSYIPMKYYEKYMSLIFSALGNLLKREATNPQYNSDLMKHLITFYICFAQSEEDTSILKAWLTTDTPMVLDVPFDPTLLSQENRFNILTLVHRSRLLPKEEKDKLLADEVIRDKNSDQSTLAKLICYSSLPDPEIKKELWNKFVNQSTSDSLYNMESLMEGFAPKNQQDLVEEYLKKKFFEVLPEIGKKNELFYIKSFVNSFAPLHYIDKETIAQMEALVEVVRNEDQVCRCLREKVDDMKRMFQAHIICEEYLSLTK